MVKEGGTLRPRAVRPANKPASADPPPELPGVVHIPVYGWGSITVAYALVDEADRDLVNDRRWNLASSGYAFGTLRGVQGRDLMHRVILGLERGDGKQVDHINRDKLDNRRKNLRLVSHGENQRNKSGWGSSEYRWVFRDGRRWRVCFRMNGRRRYLPGSFRTELSAALAAERFRREYLPGTPSDDKLEDLPWAK